MRLGIKLNALVLPVQVVTVACLLSAVAHADVTVEERSTFDLTMIKAHSTTVEMTTADKQRRTTDLQCEGFMSFFCRDAQSGQIIRLDKEVTWALEPKKKQYRESRFLTAAERQAAERQAEETLEKMKQCPTPAAPTQTAAPDPSKCEMTPPKFDVKRTDQHAMFLGHDSQLTQLAMTQSCRNKETGDTCDFVMSLDSWLTQEPIAGLEDRRAFQTAYMHKLGLDDPSSLTQTQMRQFLAPYAQGMKDLAAKAGDFKGYPLKTSFRVLFGGEHCAAAQRSAQNTGSAGGTNSGDSTTASSAGAAAAAGSVGGSIGSAASALGSKLVGGLFARKKTEQTADAQSSSTTATVPNNMVQAVEFTIETTAITAGPVTPAQFEIPAGWKLIPPEAAKGAKEFSCPKPGA